MSASDQGAAEHRSEQARLPVSVGPGARSGRPGRDPARNFVNQSPGDSYGGFQPGGHGDSRVIKVPPSVTAGAATGFAAALAPHESEEDC